MVKARQQRKRLRQRSTLTKVTFLVEGGATELNVVPYLYDKGLYPRLSFPKTETFAGGSYSEIRHWLQKNQDTVDVVLVVCDLDRASNHAGAENAAERKNLKAAIDYYEATNIKNNFFFTYPNFEQWLAAGLQCSASTLYKALGYKSDQEGKSEPKLFQKYQGKGGNPTEAARYFEHRPLYFTKKTCINAGVVDESNIDKVHSNLYYLQEYLKELNKK